jgi:hypothetical protein
MRENRLRKATLLAVASFPTVLLVQTSAFGASPRAALKANARIVVSTAAESPFWDAPDPYSYRATIGAPVEDGRLSLVVGGASGHVAHVIDTATRTPIWTGIFDEQITGVALHTASERAAISTAAGLHLLDLESGRLDLLFPGESGRIDFDVSGRNLALLRSMPEFSGSRLEGPVAELVLFDVELGAAVWRRPTSIRSPQFVSVQDGRVEAFGGEASPPVITPRAYVPSANCYLSVVLETGSVAEESCGEGASVALYAKESITQVERHSVVATSSTSSDFRLTSSAFSVGSFRLAFLATEHLKGAPTRSAGALVTLDARRGISVSEVEGWMLSGARRVENRLVYARVRPTDAGGSDDRLLIDLETGRELVRMPRRKSGDRNDWFREYWLPSGVVEYDRRGRLSFFPTRSKPPGRGAPDWSRELVPGSPVSISPNGTRVAFFPASDRARLEIRDIRYGDLLRTVSPPPEITPNWTLALALDGSNQRLLLAQHGRIWLHDLVRGAWTSVLAGEVPSIGTIWGLDEGWLLDLSSESLVVHGDGRPGPRLPVYWISWVGQPARASSSSVRRFLLVETRPGRAAWIELESGRVRTSWVSQERSRLWSYGDRAHSSIAVTNGDGTILVHPIGFSGAVEVLDLAGVTPRPVLTIYPAWRQPGDSLGWIAVTPDGLWDSSPGVEEYVHAYRGSRRLPVAERNAQRDGDEIARRLRRLLKR